MINKKIFRKAQMEAFGLILVVVLLALGIFFMSYTQMKKAKESQELSPQNIDLAQNMIDAVKNIKLYCNSSIGEKNIPLDDFIQDMAMDENRLYCIKNNVYMNSYDYLNNSLSNIFNTTLTSRNKPFYFMIRKSKTNIIYLYIQTTDADYSKCSIDFDNPDIDPPGDAGLQALPLRSGGNVEMKLFLCDSKALLKTT